MVHYVRVKEKINLYRRYPYWARMGCIFVHVPKAAGTSINRAIYGKTLGHYRAADIRRNFPNLFARSFVFSFVRNPWARALSAYQFAVQGRTESMGMRKPHQYRIPEFESFERFLLEWLVKQDLDSIDPVFQAQYKYVVDSQGAQIVDFIGRVEQLSTDIEYVVAQLGRRVNVPHDNRTSSTRSYQDAFTSDAMIRLVGDIYREDVKKFSYEF